MAQGFSRGYGRNANYLENASMNDIKAKELKNDCRRLFGNTDGIEDRIANLIIYLIILFILFVIYSNS